MRLRRILAFASTISLSCLPLTTAAHAVCDYTYTPTANGFCDGCKYEAAISLARNETCERSSQVPGGGWSTLDVQYLDSKIVVRAKHGVAGANGPAIAYQPNKDFVGTDEFVKEMSIRQAGKALHYFVRYAVTVK